MRFGRIADGLAIAVAVSLPWSSSAASILILLMLLALVPAQTPRDVLQEVATPAGGVPVALFVLAALGMTWADVSWAERFGGLDSFAKLLMIPILLTRFRRSDRGLWVMGGYLVSCTMVLVLASALALWPQATLVLANDFGVPVKNPATQTGQFVTCAFVLLFLAVDGFRRRRRGAAAGMLALALVFLANIAVLALADVTVVPLASLVIIPVLLLLLGFKQFDAKAVLGGLAAAAVLCAVVWAASPHLRHHATALWDNLQPFPGNDQNLAGARPEFWKKSLGFIGDAPLVGHGTGCDTAAVRALRRRPDRLLGTADDRSAAADARGRNPAWPRRDRRAVGDVARASAAVSRRQLAGMDRARGRDPEHRGLAVEFPPV